MPKYSASQAGPQEPGVQGVITPPDFGKSVNPIPTWGQIMPTTLLLTPGFSSLPTALLGWARQSSVAQGDPGSKKS